MYALFLLLFRFPPSEWKEPTQIAGKINTILKNIKEYESKTGAPPENFDELAKNMKAVRKEYKNLMKRNKWR